MALPDFNLDAWEQRPDSYDSAEVRSYLYEPQHANETSVLVARCMAEIAHRTNKPMIFQAVKVLPAQNRRHYIAIMARGGLFRAHPQQTIHLVRHAIETKDTDLLRDLIAGGLNLSLWVDEEHTLLHLICKEGTPEMVSHAVTMAQDDAHRWNHRLNPFYRNPLAIVDAEGQQPLDALKNRPDFDDVARHLRQVGLADTVITYLRPQSTALQRLPLSGIHAGTYVTGDDLELWLELAVACQRGNTELTHQLIDSMGDIELQTPLLSRVINFDKRALDVRGGDTCLRWASRTGNLELALQLLQHGAYLDQDSVDHLFPAAVNNHHAPLIEALLQRGARHPKAENILLEQACAANDLTRVRGLLDYGIDVNAFDEDRKTVLMKACERGQTELVRALLDRRAAPNQPMKPKDPPPPRPLASDYVSSEEGGFAAAIVDNAEQEAERSTEEKLAAKEGWTALTFAINAGQFEIADILLEHGADINQRSADGRTPLHILCNGQNTSVEAIHYLIDQGADVEARDAQNHTPTSLALSKGNIWMAGQLIIKGADYTHLPSQEAKNGLLCLASLTGVPELFNEALQKGANPQSRTTTGATPLHFAAMMSQEWCLRELLRLGADPNAPDQYGQTPLHYASIYRQAVAQHVLIEGGADPTLRDHTNATPEEAFFNAQFPVTLSVLHDTGSMEAAIPQAPSGASFEPLQTFIERYRSADNTYADAARMLESVRNRAQDIGIPGNPMEAARWYDNFENLLKLIAATMPTLSEEQQQVVLWALNDAATDCAASWLVMTRHIYRSLTNPALIDLETPADVRVKTMLTDLKDKCVVRLNNQYSSDPRLLGVRRGQDNHRFPLLMHHLGPMLGIATSEFDVDDTHAPIRIFERVNPKEDYFMHYTPTVITKFLMEEIPKSIRPPDKPPIPGMFTKAEMLGIFGPSIGDWMETHVAEAALLTGKTEQEINEAITNGTLAILINDLLFEPETTNMKKEGAQLIALASGVIG